MKRQFNPAISFIRVASMLSIIIGHMAEFYGINHYQLLANGVEIFLFISGFLYGNYTIDSWVRWLRVRWLRLIPPLYCTIAIYTGICVVIGQSLDWKPFVVYALNFQGAKWIIRNLDVPSFLGMGQAWFITVIFVCYALVIGMKKCSKVERLIEKHPLLSLSLAIAVQIIFCYIGIQLGYILQFFIGYFISKKSKGENNWVTKRSFLIVTILTALFVGLRLCTRGVIDGTVLYDMIIAKHSFNVLAIWLVMFFIKISEMQVIGVMVKNKWWKCLDIASYALFLTHYMFLEGPMNVANWSKNPVEQIIVFTFLTLISGMVVLFITERENLIRLFKAEN